MTHAALQADLTTLIARFDQAQRETSGLDLSAVLMHLTDALIELEVTYPADIEDVIRGMVETRREMERDDSRRGL
jgi:hypothetical protein